jgi:hypothetical protein
VKLGEFFAQGVLTKLKRYGRIILHGKREFTSKLFSHTNRDTDNGSCVGLLSVNIERNTLPKLVECFFIRGTMRPLNV